MYTVSRQMSTASPLPNSRERQRANYGRSPDNREHSEPIMRAQLNISLLTREGRDEPITAPAPLLFWHTMCTNTNRTEHIGTVSDRPRILYDPIGFLTLFEGHTVEDSIRNIADSMKTGLLAGLGACVITREKAEAAVNRLAERGKLAADDAQKLVDDLVSSGREQADDVRGKVRASLGKALGSADIARSKQVKDIAKRLEKVEQRITMIENMLEK